MNNNEDINAMIKSYQFTVLILGAVIIGMFLLMSLILLVYVPDVLVVALDEYYADAEVLITK